MNPPKGRTCPSQGSECPSRMDPIPLAVSAAPLGVHKMPSLRPRLPNGRAQRFKCHQSAAQRFSPYLPHALQAKESKKRQLSRKMSNLSLTMLRVPVSNGPDSSCNRCGAPWGTQNALTSTQSPQWQSTTLQMSPVSSAEIFTLPATCIASK